MDSNLSSTGITKDVNLSHSEQQTLYSTPGSSFYLICKKYKHIKADRITAQHMQRYSGFHTNTS